MKALAILSICVIACAPGAQAAGVGGFGARGLHAPRASSKPIALSRRAFARRRGDDLLGGAAFGDYSWPDAEVEEGPQNLASRYVAPPLAPWCVREPALRPAIRPFAGPRILYIGKAPAASRNAVRVIYGAS